MIRLLMSLLVLAPFAAPAEAANKPAAAPAAAPANRAPFSSERIGITVRGSGPDVVLVPGLSSSPAAWESTVAALPGYRFHIVHVSGFAGRAAGANASGEVVAPVAEEIARYIAEAGLRRPAIVGHSLGGSWAMMVAGRHPGLVSKVMVVDMMPFLGAMFAGPTATAESVKPIADQIRKGIAGANGDARRTAIEQTIAGMVRTESMRPRAIEDSMTSNATVSGQAMYDLITTDLRPDLARIQVPLTVLWVRPPSAPVTDEQMAGFYKASFAGAPQARIVNVPDSYHFIMWDAPERFRQELKTFLTAN
jgi:pimeloyl-ACP methyl ester carboxylesterase